ncbi:C1 family peptidase [Lentilactobacillus sp. SPB1-3]|uniref:C1 family peptidase n=1 Tax=Lentilactobacillus terminaliae TaxID=3003483 RepID=A0ACD5DF15_9LACO|nr:C1 family peptidase [Lentilactobacillus sp. SPB1-3]MCZ0976269.1 C1 family peptidase [Lentilactobacillus sp. SPB1-3]
MTINNKLTEEQISSLRQNYVSQPNSDLMTRIITQNGINQAAKDPDATVRLTPVFSIDLPTGTVTNQRQSGRCWLFSLLNTLRHQFAKANNIKDFELSEKYLFFWDKIERANIYYDRMIALANRPADDRDVEYYLSGPGSDGGQWAMAVSLIEKYGVMPASQYPDTQNVENTGALKTVLNQKLRKDGMLLRRMVNDGSSDEEITEARSQMLSEVYKIVTYSLGVPPTEINFAYRDDDKQYHKIKDITPQQFLQQNFKTDFDDYVVLTNSPDKEFNRLYSLPSSQNVVGGTPIEFLNVEMNYLKQSAVAQLKSGETVWFGNDVLEQMDRKQGYLDSQLYRYSELFDVDLKMSKAERLKYHQANVSHAMTLVGVDLDDDDAPVKWKVENSWGDQNGVQGYFTMNDNWMEDYVYEVVVRKEFITDEQRQLLGTAPIELPTWDSLT